MSGAVGPGEVLEVFVPTMTTIRAFPTIGRDVWVVVTHPGASGIYVGYRRAHLQKNQRSQVTGVPKKVALGKGQDFWIRNETGAGVYVSFDIHAQVRGEE